LANIFLSQKDDLCNVERNLQATKNKAERRLPKMIRCASRRLRSVGIIYLTKYKTFTYMNKPIT